MTLLDIRPADDADAFREMVAATRNGSFRTDRSWRHIKADGSAIDVEAYSQSLQYRGTPGLDGRRRRHHRAQEGK